MYSSAKGRAKGYYIWLTLSIVCAVGIFLSSSVEGDQSGAASMALAEYIRQLLDIEPETLNFIVRKGAHLTVFAALGFCVANTVSYKVEPRYKTLLIAWAIASAYGVLDEIHQYFVPLRVMDVTDMLINSVGAMIGAAVAVILLVKGRVYG